MPEPLKSNVETMSGFSLDEVRVHRNSSEPAVLGALAYTRGRDIHLAPGQERHLPHEAWHVVQQKQGRVRATTQLKGLGVNTDPALEAEADMMGARAAREQGTPGALRSGAAASEAVCQRKAGIEYETGMEARHLTGGDPGVTLAARQQAWPGQAPFDAQHWVAQNEVMANGAGWKVVSDNSKLEFVTDPAVEIDALRVVVANMVGVLNNAAVPSPADTLRRFSVALPGPQATGEYYVFPYARKKLTGKMQGTIGIPFAKLAAFFELVAEHDLTASTERVVFAQQRLQQAPNDEQVKEQLETFQGNLKAVTETKAAKILDVGSKADQAIQAGIQAHEGTSQEKAKFRGMMMLVGQYIAYSQTYASSYAKKSFPIMARTSFAAMYKALSRFYRLAFPAVATDLVVRLGRQPGDKAFPAADDRKLGPTGTFTLAEWIASVVRGVDRFVASKDPRTAQQIEDDVHPGETVKSDMMTAPGGKISPTDASMGSMGLDAGKVVVELRDLQEMRWPNLIANFVDDLAVLERAGE